MRICSVTARPPVRSSDTFEPWAFARAAAVAALRAAAAGRENLPLETTFGQGGGGTVLRMQRRRGGGGAGRYNTVALFDAPGAVGVAGQGERAFDEATRLGGVTGGIVAQIAFAKKAEHLCSLAVLRDTGQVAGFRSTRAMALASVEATRGLVGGVEF